jgi:hypothetical protein
MFSFSKIIEATAFVDLNGLFQGLPASDLWFELCNLCRSMICTCNSMKLHEVPQHIPTATQKWGYIRCPAKVGGSKILIGWDNKWVILVLSKLLQLDVVVLLPGCIPGYYWKKPSNISVAGASTHFALLHSLGTRQIAEGDLAIDHLAPSNSRDGFPGAAKKHAFTVDLGCHHWRLSVGPGVLKFDAANISSEVKSPALFVNAMFHLIIRRPFLSFGQTSFFASFSW